MATQPTVIVLGGPNGAGKSTAADLLLPERIEFVNADEIAKTLPEYPSREADLKAGRLVLERLDELERLRTDFAVETTLAGRGLAARIVRLRAAGYRFRLIFIWSPSAEFSIQRVAARVRAGGHDIPEETIRRRYEAGLKNFFDLYRPLADKWDVYDATGATPRLIVGGIMGGETPIGDPDDWRRMQQGAGNG